MNRLDLFPMFRNIMKSPKCLLLTILLWPTGAWSANKMESFFGVWADEREGCRSANEKAEGQYFVLQKDWFMPGWGGGCTELRLWMAGESLRLSTTCEGEEAGFDPFVMELEHLGDNKLNVKHGTIIYTRCPGKPWGLSR